MLGKSEEKIEDLAENIQTEKELKALVFHQDFIYETLLQPEIDKMESSGKKDTAKAFQHYNSTYRKIIAYLWKELLIAKNPELKEEEST